MAKYNNRKNQLIVIGLFIALIACTFLMTLMKLPSAEEASAVVDKPLLTAFKESEADFTCITAQGWCQIDTVFHGGEELFSFYESIKEVLGDDDLLSIDEYDDQSYAGITVFGNTEQGYEMDLVLQSMADEASGSETYLIVNLSDEQDVRDIDEVDTYLGTIFAAVSSKSEPSLLIEGEYDELKSKREKKKIAKAIFKALDGKIEEKISDDGYVSYSGYTELISNSITSDNRKINLQVALSDNEQDQSTIIYIGSPVVFSDF
ncbi:MAG TPA: YwmB family TATA-box binding protein [Clostridiales bacterium]|nr:YwmB family TATA-box binding protein [Clostridiales bacterium]